ncbi:MAG: phytanoyl-CoA dioxygenase [Bacteroidetes bacterium]|nr:phytanoyl-CoA dioxygenase [Bacteroidota bacterium]
MNALTTKQIDQFVDEGFVKLENAFSADIARDCVSILWKETGCDPDRHETWTKPVVRVGELGHEPFIKAANTPILHEAFDQLVGIGNWHPRTTLGSFPIRFPSTEKATDTGWHVDASYPGENASSYFDWRINIHSKGRGLLMLFLFSDVSQHDAPTLIKIGSHLDVAKILEPKGEKGLSFMELAKKISSIPQRPEIKATGKAGTVYLCHPFIVHAAQDHHGKHPKFMAQPGLLTRNDFSIKRSGDNNCPVIKAILKGLKG